MRKSNIEWAGPTKLTPAQTHSQLWIKATATSPFGCKNNLQIAGKKWRRFHLKRSIQLQL